MSAKRSRKELVKNFHRDETNLKVSSNFFQTFRSLFQINIQIYMQNYIKSYFVLKQCIYLNFKLTDLLQFHLFLQIVKISMFVTTFRHILTVQNIQNFQKNQFHHQKGIIKLKKFLQMLKFDIEQQTELQAGVERILGTLP